MPFPRALARVNRRFTNRILGRLVGRLPSFGEIEHVGRRTGRAYRTPVAVHRADGADVIALTYGSDADWVRNVLAAGEATVRDGRGTRRVTDPEVQRGDPAMALLPLPVRLFLKLLRAEEVLHLRPPN